MTTGLTPRQALEQAIAYFGHGGMGLQVISQSPQGLVFQGGGGHVGLTVQAGATTTLELETREWDVAVRRFMEQVSYRPRWWSRWWRRKRSAAPPAPVFNILNNTPERRCRGGGYGVVGLAVSAWKACSTGWKLTRPHREDSP